MFERKYVPYAKVLLARFYYEVLHSWSDTVCVDHLPNVAEKDNDKTSRRINK